MQFQILKILLSSDLVPPTVFHGAYPQVRENRIAAKYPLLSYVAFIQYMWSYLLSFLKKWDGIKLLISVFWHIFPFSFTLRVIQMICRAM